MLKKSQHVLTIPWNKLITMGLPSHKNSIQLIQVCTMGDYRYTELSYKITSLISRIFCLCGSGLTYTQADAGVNYILCNYYRNITTKLLSMHFNYLFMLLLISLETTMPHLRRVLLYSRFYIHKFPHQTDGRVVYMISHFMTRCIS